jgi:hypothetical protein
MKPRRDGCRAIRTTRLLVPKRSTAARRKLRVEADWVGTYTITFAPEIRTARIIAKLRKVTPAILDLPGSANVTSAPIEEA